MPSVDLSIDTLHLDLDNYRTIHQKDEVHAVNTMISINEKRFYALMNSIIDDGYIHTENIIVLQDGKNIVKEGNRRVAILKIIFGHIKNIDLPEDYQEKIDKISEEWKKNNLKIPCLVFKSSDSQKVDKIIAQIHAKGEDTSREEWKSIATARYNRDKKGATEPGLILFEKFLDDTNKLSQEDKERWSGNYPVTILNEAMSKIFSYLKCSSQVDLANCYPNKNKRVLEKIIMDIGLGELTFPIVRDKLIFFGLKYEINPSADTATSSSTPTTSTPSTSSSYTTCKKQARATNDPRSVYEKLEKFKPRGDKREKVVALLDELKTLNLKKYPNAFCFLLRSMFEISAKAYCEDHRSSGGPTATKPNGQDKSLKNLLDEITDYITNGKKDSEKTRLLHGAMADLAKGESILSVTSMNQLVHNPNFSPLPKDISINFHNIFPLLEEMNK